MGITVPRALISALLTAGLFFVPTAVTAQALDTTATTTESTVQTSETATSTAPTQPLASTTDTVIDDHTESADSTTESSTQLTSTTISVDEEDAPDIVWGCIEETDTEGNSLERCGTGYYRELCVFIAGVKECTTFFEIIEEEKDAFTLTQEDLFKNEYLSLSASVNGQTLVDNGTIALPTGTLGTIQWSYTGHAPTPFTPLFENFPISFPDALAASTLTFQIYKGAIGAATLVHTETIPQGTLPEVSFTSLGEGQYIFVLSSTFPKDTYPPGLEAEDTCGGGGGDFCLVYQTRIEDFTWFMQHGKALYDDVEDEIDEDRIVEEDGERVSRMSRFKPLAFGMVEVTIGLETPPSGVSNVLFLPGIKGSRLYSSETKCGVIGCDNQVWDPRSSDDVQDLYLTPDGKSSRSDIYVKDGEIIDSVLGTRIYKSFIDDMNDLQASTTYAGGQFTWKPVAYDWRLSLNDIVSNGAEHDGGIYYDQATSSPYIEQTLRELARTSTTGKVTIVAHSNGGLVTKALLQKLGDSETALLVDRIIFVGVPQTGAPQALGGLMFGDREGLPHDLLPIWATPAVARGLAENSPMAYHLLPSYAYLRDTQDPNHSIIGFSGKHLYQVEQRAYGPSVDTVAELDDFLLAREGGRTKPAFTDLTVANVLNSHLISYANDTHTSLDSWTPPASVSVYQIAGWGANTISGIDFYDEQKLLGATVGHKRQYRPIFVEDGDGVVPVPSALAMSTAPNVHNYWLNLQSARAGLSSYKHGNIFELLDTRNFVSEVLMGIAPSESNIILLSQPSRGASKNKLIFQLHSPLTLGLYDSDGNYTGLNNDGSVSEQVEGVEYGEFGDVKYLIAPAGTQYELVMNGQTDGTFSLDIQEQNGDTLTTTTIADVPTTAHTIAKLSITNGVTDASALVVDNDANGVPDTQLTPVSGETVQYVAPATSVSVTGSSSGSGTAAVRAIAFAAPTPTLPAFTASSVLNPRVLGVKTEIVPKTNSEEIAEEVYPKPQTQTASVYDAFTQFTEWVRTLLYNVWKGFLNKYYIFLRNRTL